METPPAADVQKKAVYDVVKTTCLSLGFPFGPLQDPLGGNTVKVLPELPGIDPCYPDVRFPIGL